MPHAANLAQRWRHDALVDIKEWQSAAQCLSGNVRSRLLVTLQEMQQEQSGERGILFSRLDQAVFMIRRIGDRGGSCLAERTQACSDSVREFLR